MCPARALDTLVDPLPRDLLEWKEEVHLRVAIGIGELAEEEFLGEGVADGRGADAGEDLDGQLDGQRGWPFLRYFRS